MKKLLILLLIINCEAIFIASAQVTNKINYQAVARNSSGAILANQLIGLRISVEQGSGGPVIYQERHTPTTNQFGLFTVPIGGGTVLAGSYSGITWAAGGQWLKVDMDPTGGSSYVSMGESELLSTPYANVASQSNSPWAPNGFNIYNTNFGNIGIGTTTPTSLLEISAAQPDAKINWTNSANFGRLLFAESGTTTATVQQVGGTYGNTDRQKALEIQNLTATGNITLWTNGIEQMRILSNGTIGIGTTTPQFSAKVHAKASVGDGPIIYAENTYASVNAQSAGIWGIAEGSPGCGYGVYGEGGHAGVWGYGYGTGTSNPTFGVRGEAQGSTGANYGVLGLASGASSYGVYCNGNGGYTGTWSNLSDRRFKKDIEPVNGALAMVEQVNAVTYNLKREEYPSFHFPAGRQFGFVAQELEKVIPNLVETGVQPGEKGEELIECKSVNYIGMIPILASAIQELNAKVDRLQSENQSLKTEISTLKGK